VSRIISLLVALSLTGAVLRTGESGGGLLDPVDDVGGTNLPYSESSGVPDYTDKTNVRIGLYYGNSGLAYANLQNETGRGYRFGYFEGGLEFVALGSYADTKITMLKNRNLYINTANEYVDDAPTNRKGTVGCYHIRVGGRHDSFESAKTAASKYTGGFPAYYFGSYYVHVGNYFSSAEASADNNARGLGGTVLTGSDKCVTVVVSGTSDIVFQFDYGAERALGVMPIADAGVKAITWFKGYKYYGGFEYTRNSSASNMTVVNVVNIDDYTKGVLPYEMSTSWPNEALKAQAICARTYAAYNKNKHRTYGFDLCTGTDCQVYMGVNRSDVSTDRAVDETVGQYIMYDGKLASVFYFSSDGGATENSENVFSEALPWLRGVKDSYEPLVKTGKESWTTEYKASEITAILQSKGYPVTDIVSVTPTYTPMGNMFSMKFTDSRGKTFTFEREAARSILNSKAHEKSVYSQRFSIVSKSGASSPSPSAAVMEGVEVVGLEGTPDELYAIGADGVTQKVTPGDAVAATSSGTEQLITGEKGQPLISGQAQSGNAYVVQGSGWGHNIGMSQYGAKAMAEAGFSAGDILRFYFTNITIS
jgi:stage II sporulation protein D